MGPFRWIQYCPIFESNLAPLIITQGWFGPNEGLKLVPAWAEIAFWWGYFGLNCGQIALGEAESDFGLQGWIGNLGLKQRDLSSFSVGSSRYDPVVQAKK